MESDTKLTREVHQLVRDLMPLRKSVYWSDFAITWTVAVLGLYFLLFGHGWQSWFGWVLSSLSLYRLSVFTHEISHFRAGQFDPFVIIWNVLAGIPCLLPSFLYGDHRAHHVNHSYGTEHDAEYYPLAHGPIWAVVGYCMQIFVLPVGAIVRFLAMTPLGALIPSLRRTIWGRFSSMLVINPKYRRPEPPKRGRFWIWLTEFACFAYLTGWVVLLVLGIIPWIFVGKLYAVFVLATSINFYRALGSHRYTNTGGEMRYIDQLLDSTTVEGMPVVTGLIAPLGMRYHALHHLVPSLPYHSLGEAHRRLVAELPADSPYRQTIYPSIWAAVSEVCRGAWERSPVKRAPVAGASATRAVREMV